MSEENEFDFNHYFKYEELTLFLKKMEEKHAGIAKLHSLCKSSTGRDVWLLEITNFETGLGRDKPGYYIDGNTHASEVAGSMVCLYTIRHLLTTYGKDDFVKELLNSKVIYVLPRIDVDGAEVFLTTPQVWLGTAKFYPFAEEEWGRREGLYGEDVNGDGYITQMRIKDPNGDWKISDKDPRLMIKRRPEETGGSYYKVYLEGLILNYRGDEIKIAPAKYGMNLNRNFPGDWVPENVQPGSGLVPISEPEVRAVVDFWLSHPNIGGMVTYHTHGGVIVRAFDNKPDSEFIEKDLVLFKTIGAMGTEITGYPNVSSFEDFTRDKKKPRHGCTDGWTYLSRGIPGFCLELWDLAKHSGLGGFKERGGVYFRLDALKEEDALKPLLWLDKELNGQGFSNWHSFKHPQLGDVEIGGWSMKFTWRNPPERFLGEECKRVFMFPLRHASLLPLVKITSSKAIKVAQEVFRIEMIVENLGFLPTNISEQAVQANAVKPVVAYIGLNEDASLLIGREWVEIGHLKGLFDKLPELPAPTMEEGSKKKIEWIVKAVKSKKVKLTVQSEKGGTDTKEVQLE